MFTTVVAALTGDPPVTIDGVLDEEIHDNTVAERLRRLARDRPEATFATLYNRHRAHRSPTTCWKHRIAYADRVTVDREAFGEWLVSGDDRLERELADELDVTTHDAWIERSYVPEYEPSESVDIPIAYGGTTRSTGDRGLYDERTFDSPIPFVYVPDGDRKRAIRWLVDRFREEYGG